MKNFRLLFLPFLLFQIACNSGDEPRLTFSSTVISVDNKVKQSGDTLQIENINPVIRVGLSVALDINSVESAVSIVPINESESAPFTFSYTDGFLQITPTLSPGKIYLFAISESLSGLKKEIFTPISLVIELSAGSLQIEDWTVDTQSLLGTGRISNVSSTPTLTIQFSNPVTVAISDHIRLFNTQRVEAFDLTLATDSRSLTITPKNPLANLSKYTISILSGYSNEGFELAEQRKTFYTEVDNTSKFPEITDEELMTLVQQQTFKFFYDHAGPTSGMARERNNSGSTVTSGGSGFGIMSLIVGMERGFITREQGLDRIEKILTYLERADRFHGVYSHWMDDVTGRVVPFSQKDNGGDLVETSFLFQGLLTFRQYMQSLDTREQAIIDRINTLWSEVEWDWYTQGGQNVLYWHWSPNYGWEMNFALRGYYEAMITYVLAASSTTHTIPKEAYHQGWMRSGGVKNGKQFFGITLPLGYDYGGPLFFAHYSFLGLDPRNLSDVYANYWEQNVAHSLINYEHCIRNPRNHVNYNGIAWGLTASDQPSGYGVHEPTNDNGTISPTAALSSFPYTPEESMEAMKYFYYILGDKLWGEFGFYDAYNVNEGWWASSTLAIDQGPIIVMIENYRTGLLWDLFMSAPEVQSGLTKLEIAYE